MESGGSWNILTASLAVSNLEQPAAAWAFLVWQGLVRDAPGDRDLFFSFLGRELERGPITGPTVALRVGTALESAGITLPAGTVPDPWAKIAGERLKLRGGPSADPGRD